MCAWKGTRPPNVVERDTAVSELLTEKGPMTRNALVEELIRLAKDPESKVPDLDFSKQKVYLSLDRLRKAGKAKRCFSETSNYPLWTVSVEEPCA